MKKDIFTYGSIRCEVRCKAPSPSAVIVVLYPAMDYDWLDTVVEEFGCAIAVVSVPDWDNDLSPWPAPGQPPGSEDFKGLAGEFSKTLVCDLMPRILERIPGVQPARRILTGISMSGLFALWLWLQNSYFTDMISISGSFWYQGFAEWVGKQTIPQKTGIAYFSLGNKETHTAVKAFRSVGVNTDSVINRLRQGGIDAIFEPTVGTHYAPIYPRLKSAFEAMKLD